MTQEEFNKMLKKALEERELSMLNAFKKFFATYEKRR